MGDGMADQGRRWSGTTDRKVDRIVTPQTSKARIPAPALVLCIDDDPLVLHFYEDFLPEHGYQTLTATDGLVGIQIAADACPDVILLDVMLRGLSGFDICRMFAPTPRLREIRSSS